MQVYKYKIRTSSKFGLVFLLGVIIMSNIIFTKKQKYVEKNKIRNIIVMLGVIKWMNIQMN